MSPGLGGYVSQRGGSGGEFWTYWSKSRVLQPGQNSIADSIYQTAGHEDMDESLCREMFLRWKKADLVMNLTGRRGWSPG